MTDSRFAACAVTLAAALLLGACSSVPRLSPYRIDVRQGNLVTQDMVAQLKPGMTKDQVRFVLGTPLVTDMFHADRWDYVYRFKPGWGEAESRALSVYFRDGRLARVAGDVVAADASAPAERPSAPRVLEIGPQSGSAAPAAAPASGPAPANSQ